MFVRAAFVLALLGASLGAVAQQEALPVHFREGTPGRFLALGATWMAEVDGSTLRLPAQGRSVFLSIEGAGPITWMTRGPAGPIVRRHDGRSADAATAYPELVAGSARLQTRLGSDAGRLTLALRTPPGSHPLRLVFRGAELARDAGGAMTARVGGRDALTVTSRGLDGRAATVELGPAGELVVDATAGVELVFETPR